MPTTHHWSVTIPFLPPSTGLLKDFSPAARSEARLLWFNRLKKAFGTTPQAAGRRRLTVIFHHAPESEFDPEQAAVDWCLVSPLCPQPEVAGRFSRGRRTGASFFSSAPGLGLILGGKDSGWLEVKVSEVKVQGLFQEGTELILEDIAAGDLPQDRITELCRHTERLQQALWAFTQPFTGPDSDIAEGMARASARELLEQPAPRLLDLHRRGQVVLDTGEEAS